MIRSRTTRSVVAATTSVVLILGLMAGTTSAKKPGPTAPPAPTPTPLPTPTPTPTPNSDNRSVYFGDLELVPDSNGLLNVSPATTGKVFAFDVIARNTGGQNLTHAQLAFGDATAPNANGTVVGLPAGATILDVDTAGVGCEDETRTTTSYVCDVGSLRPGTWLTARFFVAAGPTPVSDAIIRASFKVAENVNDQGANRNTFFAEDTVNIALTSKDAIGTYLPGALELSTKGIGDSTGDPQSTSVRVEGAENGFISIVETNGPTGCPAPCIGQTVSLNVNDGQIFDTFVEWRLEIVGSSAIPNKGGVVHTLDDGTEELILNTKANACSTTNPVNCFVSYTVNKKLNLTTLVFRTDSNGAARAW